MQRIRMLAATARLARFGTLPGRAQLARLSGLARSTSTQTLHATTIRWVDEMIIGLNLCPYTRAVKNREALRCIVSEAEADDALLREVSAETALLAAGGGPETSLLIVPPTSPWGLSLNDDFGAFLSLGWQIEDRLAELAPTTLELQLALFHPRAVRSMYAATDEDEAADYAMRSPYPTIHLLRTSDVQALPPKHAAQVPERNRATLESLGVAHLTEMHAKLEA